MNQRPRRRSKTVEIPCEECFHYRGYSPNWCQLLGKKIETVDDINMYFERIPNLKTDDCCMGFRKKINAEKADMGTGIKKTLSPGKYLEIKDGEGEKPAIWKRIVRASGLVEWQCEHGVGHPDEAAVKRMGDDSWGIHGCDGCCSRDDFPGKASKEKKP